MNQLGKPCITTLDLDRLSIPVLEPYMSTHIQPYTYVLVMPQGRGVGASLGLVLSVTAALPVLLSINGRLTTGLTAFGNARHQPSPALQFAEEQG